MEKILMEIGCKSFPYKQNGQLSEDGIIAYDKLINIICELNRIGVIQEDVDYCEKLFDEIINDG